MRELPYRFQLLEKLKQTVDVDHEGRNLLSSLFRRIKNDLEYTPRTWSTMVQKYLKDPRNKVGTSSAAKSSEASNLNRGLTVPNMTFMNFMKGMRVINPKALTFKFNVSFGKQESLKAEIRLTNEDLYTEPEDYERLDIVNPLKYLLSEILLERGLADSKGTTNSVEILNKTGRHELEIYLTERRPELSKAKIPSERSYLLASLKKREISMKVFCKFLEMINPTYTEFSVEFHFGNGVETQHQVSVENDEG